MKITLREIQRGIKFIREIGIANKTGEFYWGWILTDSDGYPIKIKFKENQFEEIKRICKETLELRAVSEELENPKLKTIFGLKIIDPKEELKDTEILAKIRGPKGNAWSMREAQKVMELKTLKDLQEYKWDFDTYNALKKEAIRWIKELENQFENKLPDDRTTAIIEWIYVFFNLTKEDLP